MTNADISNALREECYLTDINEQCGGYNDLIPLLLVLRYKALHSDIVFEAAEKVPVAKETRISSMYWLP